MTSPAAPDTGPDPDSTAAAPDTGPAMPDLDGNSRPRELTRAWLAWGSIAGVCAAALLLAAPLLAPNRFTDSGTGSTALIVLLLSLIPMGAALILGPRRSEQRDDAGYFDSLRPSFVDDDDTDRPQPAAGNSPAGNESVLRVTARALCTADCPQHPPAERPGDIAACTQHLAQARHLLGVLAVEGFRPRPGSAPDAERPAPSTAPTLPDPALLDAAQQAAAAAEQRADAASARADAAERNAAQAEQDAAASAAALSEAQARLDEAQAALAAAEADAAGDTRLAAAQEAVRDAEQRALTAVRDAENRARAAEHALAERERAADTARAAAETRLREQADEIETRHAAENDERQAAHAAEIADIEARHATEIADIEARNSRAIHALNDTVEETATRLSTARAQARQETTDRIRTVVESLQSSAYPGEQLAYEKVLAALGTRPGLPSAPRQPVPETPPGQIGGPRNALDEEAVVVPAYAGGETVEQIGLPQPTFGPITELPDAAEPTTKNRFGRRKD